ncbi:uncharacterized protein BDFB_004577, partial [Asbolus verrucosus]
MNCYKTVSCEGSSMSHMIVSEIMNDILDNTFEVILAKNIQQAPKVEKISPNVVGDILDNILSPPQNTETSNEPYRHDETALLDDEIKRIIKEMMYPPEQKSIICTQGVGDQLGDKSEITPDKILAEPVKRNTLERKNRLTNLVRNSKQMLARFVSNESDNDLKMAKSEETHEKLIKVIDLDADSSNFAEAGSSSAVPRITQMPSESTMDLVDLEPHLQKNDYSETETDEREIASSKIEAKKSDNVTKKKWNFGAKIMKYIKRHPKKE